MLPSFIGFALGPAQVSLLPLFITWLLG